MVGHGPLSGGTARYSEVRPGTLEPINVVHASWGCMNTYGGHKSVQLSTSRRIPTCIVPLVSGRNFARSETVHHGERKAATGRRRRRRFYRASRVSRLKLLLFLL